MNHDSHAYEKVRARRFGPTGWAIGRPDGHGKNFGTMIHAVYKRSWELLGFRGDPSPYPRHEYAYEDNPRPAPMQAPPNNPPTSNPNRPLASRTRQELRDLAFRDISLDSGVDYTCTQGDLDATGGLSRRDSPEDDDLRSHNALRKRWFPKPNHGPFISASQASLDIFKHNDLRRKPGDSERDAIKRLSEAMAEGRQGFWGPDLIIKAFCDLDIVFFRGRLRGHVHIRWLPDWSAALKRFYFLLASQQADDLLAAKVLQSNSFSTVPFLRDAKFVDRRGVMEDLAGGFTSNQRMALVGLAGAGYGHLVTILKVVSDKFQQVSDCD